jgi:CheY-like chemotaxis protein
MVDKYRVLIAEDEDDIRMIGQAVLMGKGYDVIPTKDGQEAWEVYQEQKQDLSVLLTDINMPRMDGIELIGKIKQDNPEFPIVACTSYDSDKLRELVKHIVNKPFNNTNLAETVEKAVKSE